MAIYLVQHGQSLPKEVDADQGLSSQGISETETIAQVAGNYQIGVSQILHSVKTRARQTAEIFARYLNPRGGIEEKQGLKPMDDVQLFGRTLEESANMSNVMLVGHLPFMEKLTSVLVAGTADRLIFKFQNSGIVCLDKNEESPLWYIKWTLMPNIT